jgi:radical SAM-linked protein
MEFGRTNKKVASRSIAAPAVNRLRLRWGKTISQRLLSHLDNIKAIEGAIRLSQVPVTYSQGSHPRMKLSFGPPLPMGFTSECEFVDISLEQICSGPMVESIRKKMPEGFELLESKAVFARTTSLSESINRVVYTLSLDDNIELIKLKERTAKILEKEMLEILRKTKSGQATVDIRPAIYEIIIRDNDLHLTLGIGQNGYARPTEVAGLLFEIDEERSSQLQFHRKEMFRFTEDGRRIAGIEL